MRITATGNIGIGTTIPSTKLEISGNALIYPSSGPGALHIRNRTSSDVSQVIFDDATSAYRGYIGYIGSTVFPPRDPDAVRNDTVEFGTNGKDITFRCQRTASANPSPTTRDRNAEKTCLLPSLEINHL